MAKDKRQKYIIRWEPEAYYYEGPNKNVVIPCFVEKREFLWIKKIVAGPFKTFKEAGDYVYDNLHGKLSKKQSKDIYGRVR